MGESEGWLAAAAGMQECVTTGRREGSGGGLRDSSSCDDPYDNAFFKKCNTLFRKLLSVFY